MGAAGACAGAEGRVRSRALCRVHGAMRDTAQASADKFGVTGAYGNDKALHADREVEAVGGRGARAGAL